MLERLDLDEFDRVMALMESSFPADERRTSEAQRAVLNDAHYVVYVARDRAGEIEGFITVWQWDDLAFVEHFAVAPDRRGTGLGSHMLGEVAASVARGRLLCLEVELPETELARRRIAFYERNGFCLNDHPYEQPAYAPDRAAVPLLIMTYGGGIDRATFKSVRDALYRRVYGI